MTQIKKRPSAPAKGRARKKRGPQSAQQTIPYREMLKDGICKVREGYYTKTLSYEDINYAVASSDDQSTIFDGYCAFLNYFDAALPFQMSFINHRSRPENRYSVNILPQEDDFNSIRGEFTDMLKTQIAKSNNGIVRSKYITFGINADGIGTARPRLERIEADIMGNFKKLGVSSASLNGRERLEVIHSQLHPGGRERFMFSWDMIPKTGMGTKDFIAPTSFDFRQSRVFRVGTTWGAATYMQIMASELSDKLLAELLEVDAEMTITMHVQTVDQTKAIKTVKAKMSDIDRMKMDEQKKAVRSGYDIDILPPDLITYPYVWGGSSPSTSFDCSGFVSWVVNHSGWNVGRLGAQGLFNACTPVSSANAKPGDLIFFVGTYDTPGVSHVGIYVGDGMMLHCGNPISYTSIETNYWQSHFYSFGRLP